jgi:hypothetical protein
MSYKEYLYCENSYEGKLKIKWILKDEKKEMEMKVEMWIGREKRKKRGEQE